MGTNGRPAMARFFRAVHADDDRWFRMEMARRGIRQSSLLFHEMRAAYEYVRSQLAPGVESTAAKGADDGLLSPPGDRGAAAVAPHGPPCCGGHHD